MLSAEEWNEKFRKRLSARMELIGITNRELARRIYLSEKTVGSYRNGVRTPTAYTITLMAEALDCTIEYLIGNMEEEQ